MNSKISNLNSATVLTDTDVLPIVNGAETKKVTVALLKAQISVPTQTSQLINNGSNGVNPFITALDIPTTGQASTLVREVKNMTGATLTKGTVVYISGANGNKPLVSKAIATTDVLSARTFGLLQSDISNNGLGNCVIIGDLSGLDTSSFTEGVQLYLSGVTAGTYTSTETLAPTHLVYVGKVTRSHPTLGQIEVGIQNGYELKEIHDVQIITPTNNQALIYETSSDLWKNKSITDALGYTPIKSVVKDCAQGSTITGTTAETLTGTYLIPANTFATNDIMKITSFLAEKTGVVGTCTMKVKIGTTNVFSSATSIGVFVSINTNTVLPFQRFNLMVRSGFLRVIAPTASNLNDVGVSNSYTYSNLTFNPAIDNYIFTSLQLSNIADSVFQSNFIMTN